MQGKGFSPREFFPRTLKRILRIHIKEMRGKGLSHVHSMSLNQRSCEATSWLKNANEMSVFEPSYPLRDRMTYVTAVKAQHLSVLSPAHKV